MFILCGEMGWTMVSALGPKERRKERQSSFLLGLTKGCIDNRDIGNLERVL